MNPFITFGSNNVLYNMTTIYEPLVIDFNGKITPWIAKSWTYNKALTVITIHLRRGVTWSDGVPFTSKDVAFTYRLLHAGNPTLQGSFAFSEVKSVATPNPLTVVVTLTKPDGRFWRDSGAIVSPTLGQGGTDAVPIVPEHIWKGQDPNKFSNLDLAKGWPVGTGPYRLVNVTPYQQVYDRLSCAKYWGCKIGFTNLPAPQRLIVVGTSGTGTVSQDFIHNQIDGGAAVPPSELPTVQRQNPKIMSWTPKGYGTSDSCVITIEMNNQKPPFNDPNVRLAINYALNRTKISQIAYAGAYATSNVFLSPLLVNWWGHTLLGKTLAKYHIGQQDLALVKKYMAAAGYTMSSGGKWEKNGQPLVINYRSAGWHPAIAPVVAAQLNAAGFTTNAAVDASSGTTVADAISGNYTVLDFQFCVPPSEPWSDLKYWLSSWVPPAGQPMPTGIDENLSRFSNPAFDKLVNQMGRISTNITPSNKKYMALLNSAMTMLFQQMPDIPLLNEAWILPFNNTYWTGWPSISHPYGPNIWGSTAFTLVLHHIKPAA